MKTRFRTVAVGLAALLGLTLAACTSNDSTSASSAAEGSFPVRIEHRLGSTLIEKQPERVVTVGWNDQDFALALGVVPVGIRKWFDEYPTYPWVKEATGGKALPTIGEEIDYEAIAKAEPDVILAVYEEFDQETYDKLSNIAPTVLQPKEYDTKSPPWDVQLEITGKALGKLPQAQALTAKVQNKLDETKAAHPEFAGKTLVVDYGPSDEEHWLIPAGDPRRAIFDALGFSAQQESEEVSPERLDLLNRDVLFVFGARKGELKSPAFTSLPVVTEDRTLYLSFDSMLAGALSFSGPNALLYAVDRIVPQLGNATDGNPATVVESLDAA